MCVCDVLVTTVLEYSNALILPWMLWGSCSVVILSPFLSHAKRPSSRFSQNSWQRTHKICIPRHRKHYVTNFAVVTCHIHGDISPVQWFCLFKAACPGYSSDVPPRMMAETTLYKWTYSLACGSVCLFWSSDVCSILTTFFLYLFKAYVTFSMKANQQRCTITKMTMTQTRMRK